MLFSNAILHPTLDNFIHKEVLVVSFFCHPKNIALKRFLFMIFFYEPFLKKYCIPSLVPMSYSNS